MNRPIRRVAVVAALMFFALLVNVSINEVVRSPGLAGDSRNRRVRDAEYAQNRGPIMVGNVPIAQSNQQDGRFRYARSYPQARLYAPVTGWYAYDFGAAGIELNYTQQLAGTDSSQAVSRVLDKLTGKTPQGASVHTTIDPRAQQAAWDGLAGRKGAVVAIDYTTGAVLAYVSTPSYDPNTLSSTDLAKATESWKTLNADKNRPLANRASKEIYPPGSTFKLVTAAAALENGMKPDTMVDSPTVMTLPNTTTRLGNDTNCGGARTSLEHALAVSCNTAFANVGLQLGDEKLREQAKLFGFDTDVPTDVPWVNSHFPADPDRPQTALSAIGQYEVAATPLQMAMVAAGIANDGVVMRPYLAQEVRGTDLQVISSHRPTQLNRAMSASNAKLLQQMMVTTVTEGTGQRAQVDGVRVGGKTGTAQSAPNRPPYAWFVAFSDDPKIAIAVFIEDAQIERSEIAGGRLAGPIAKAVIEARR
ncbi:peptidoglycan D,D-transpeptidase FtsI family protein [Aestuariimicrobium ganziense]|uniref:peptidoglycan D,D-transpeptidase FtsI family protein n=1 Tax=Aestuariimicrobium ganziense TaxID=2773677 RepID=UPI0019432337|nr:penicillin-binding protein 2 [Aestuariimicrobium ganziense]